MSSNRRQSICEDRAYKPISPANSSSQRQRLVSTMLNYFIWISNQSTLFKYLGIVGESNTRKWYMFQKTKWTSSRGVRRSCSISFPIPNFDYSYSDVYLPSYPWLGRASSGNHSPKATDALWWGGFDWAIDMNKSPFTQPSSLIRMHPLDVFSTALS